MKRIKLFSLLAILILTMAIPNTALANKALFVASLRGETRGGGSAMLGFGPGWVASGVQAYWLSSPVLVVHIHSAVDGSILVTLCNSATPTAGVPLCTPAPNLPAHSVLVQSNLTPAMMHVPNTVFIPLLENGQTYVNVHTSDYPGGEISGALLPR